MLDRMLFFVAATFLVLMVYSANIYISHNILAPGAHAPGLTPPPSFLFNHPLISHIGIVRQYPSPHGEARTSRKKNNATSTSK
ncbi:hypothetical protein EDD55_105186 [Varunaivibrio sulfuroxidans]|uniref:Uncharacterized protein n=1 Tax=Varunaivibrio sulfuroxidans TaxID=1773489 RepID=A0A4R3J9T3_9PROT|nr:hypothetical protein EDD55_105186 [Varunaivibrio sulfuroxidans]